MSTPNIYKIYYKDATNTSKLIGYLNNITQIIPGFTGENIITNTSISLYDFTDTAKINSYIYLTNAEYTQSIYVLGFWFSVSGSGNYTLLHILGPEYKITISNKILSDSVKTFSNGLSLTNTYNMCAMVFENDKLTKIFINDTEYPLLNPIQIIPTALNFALGNDNTMSTKLNGYIGEIQILNANSFTGGKFTSAELYTKMKYKPAVATTTAATTTAPTTTAPTTTAATTTAATTTAATTTAATTMAVPETTTIIQSVEPEEVGLKIVPGTKPQVINTTTTVYVPTTTNPPIKENTGLLITV